MITATGQPTLRNPFPLPDSALPSSTGSVTTKVERSTNGPAIVGARWLERNEQGQAMGWHAEATNLTDAISNARDAVRFTAKESTVGDEGHAATTSRRVQPLAVLQGSDGAMYVARLVDQPLAGASATEPSSQWEEGLPATATRDLQEDVTYVDTAPVVKAIVSENVWFTPGAPAQQF